MVSFEGETGPYVQYAYARIQSILRKASFVPSAENDYKLADAESWDIIKHIQNFSNVVERAGDKFDPSSLLNMLSTWRKPSTSTTHTLVSWMKAQSVTAA